LRFLVTVLAISGFTIFAAARLRRYLHIFQQEEYDKTRFIAWLYRTGSVDKRVSIVLLAVWAASWLLSQAVPPAAWSMILATIFVAFAFFEPDPRRNAKKKLAMTSRASRIYGVSLALAFVAAGAVAFIQPSPWGWIAAVQAIPFLLVVADTALTPIERAIQRRYWGEARAKLDTLKPTIIGVTGSFGKTSVKHILGHALDLTGSALITPGSVNTAMGISRVVRESLRPDHRYFVVEMGAYGEGSIAKLCALAPPDIAILTAIGEAHYERFRSLDAVVRAKFEIATAVMRHPQGRIIVHQSVLDVPLAAKLVAENRDRFIVCGRGDVDLNIRNSQLTKNGINLDVDWKGQSYHLEAPLFGMQHAENLALCFAAGMCLGLSPEQLVIAFRNVPQIAHRLEVKREASGAIVIDDAYNSNPKGFASAIEVTSLLAAPEARRIVVTPGMAELGLKHDEAHRALGMKTAEHADLAIVIGSDRIPTFLEGLREVKEDMDIMTMSSFADARAWLNANAKPGDVVLIENDLPDLYESSLNL
jgi:UDP-N-acetylmuramoyl-tripeptide--D-alanyl-D-alanine ligase